MAASAGVQQLGDARRGKLLANVVAFGRALRRVGVPVDAARIALAVGAMQIVGPARRDDLGAALEAVLVSQEQDRAVFRELFDAWFRDPGLAHKLLVQMLPTTEGRAQAPRQRPRVRDALAAPGPPRAAPQGESEAEIDAVMTASDRERLRHADFNALGADEYRLVARLAREIALPVPTVQGRRLGPSAQGGARARPHWPGAWHEALRTGGEMVRLPLRVRRRQALPLLVLVDVSGSMERYARLLLAFLHAATRRGRREVFAVGTRLSALTPAFAEADTDAMLARAGALIQDFGGGTRLGDALADLRHAHARRLIGRRTLVLLVSDGLDTGEPDALREELRWLKRHSRALLWLNPLLRFPGYAPLARGATVLHAQADAMLAVHNLESLDALAHSLAALLSRGGPRQTTSPI